MIKLIVVIIISCLFSSCFVHSKSFLDCNIDPTSNSINGGDKNAKRFHVDKLFIPLVVEGLLGVRDNVVTKYVDFSDRSDELFCGYTIQGCQDTTWAKYTMAQHIIKKYHVKITDSLFLMDTIYRLEVVDESKLMFSEEDCQMQVVVKMEEEGVWRGMTCVKWGSLANLALPPEYDLSSNTVEFEPREGMYEISVPSGKAREYGLQYYSDNYLAPYGLSMHLERVDTLDYILYEYDDRLDK